MADHVDIEALRHARDASNLLHEAASIDKEGRIIPDQLIALAHAHAMTSIALTLRGVARPQVACTRTRDDR